MEVGILFKMAAIGIIITVICQILKKSDRDDIATLVVIAGIVIVFTLVVNMVSELFDTISIYKICICKIRYEVLYKNPTISN